MEKVRPWCGQPSDRGRLKNRNRNIQNYTSFVSRTDLSPIYVRVSIKNKNAQSATGAEMWGQFGPTKPCSADVSWVRSVRYCTPPPNCKKKHKHNSDSKQRSNAWWYYYLRVSAFVSRQRTHLLFRFRPPSFTIATGCYLLNILRWPEPLCWLERRRY